jgi:DNA-binding response OmpR family regulator
MKVLVADDDAVQRRLLQATLARWGDEVVLAADGEEAWSILSADQPPALAILDWLMPGVTGQELCRRARGLPLSSVYLILLTSRSAIADTVEGLEAGANDFVAKPFDVAELRARINVGRRVIALQGELAARIEDLERALRQVDQLHGLLSICSYCHSIRSDDDIWHRLEAYMAEHSGVRFSHGICPDCLKGVAAEFGLEPPSR